MDRLIAEIETETKVETAKSENKIPHQEPSLVEEKSSSEKLARVDSYINSFENKTLADIKREREAKEKEEFKAEKEVLIKQQFESVPDQQQFEIEPEPVEENIIEKPNYDLIEENPKILKIKAFNKQDKKASKKDKKKIAGIAIAIALGATGIICVGNTVLIDNLNASYLEIDETYNVNLRKYLSNIDKLDKTEKSMEFLETYPDDLLDAGDLGEKSNWFDRFCGFLSGLFGG